jgi:hypothetical protein
MQPLIPRIHVRVTLPGEDYEIDTSKVGLTALNALEVIGKISIKELMEGLESPNSRAMRALVWWARYLAGRHENLDSIEFNLTDLQAEPLDDDDAVDPTQPEPPEDSAPDTSEPSETSSDSPLT